jgi:hypothetical protein
MGLFGALGVTAAAATVVVPPGAVKALAEAAARTGGLHQDMAEDTSDDLGEGPGCPA